MFRLALVVAGVLALWPFAITFAQEPGLLDLSGSCTGDVIELRLVIEDPGGAPEMVGYDIYRSVLGSCEDAVRITESPIPRNTLALIDERIEDPLRAPSVMYGYDARPVDATRQPLNAFEIFPGFSASGKLAYVSCGLAPIYHGTVMGLGWAANIEEPCLASCLVPPGFYIEGWPAEAEGYLDGMQDVIVYGTISCEPGYFEGCLMFAQLVLPQGCTVAGDVRSWSALKGDYR